MVGKGNKGGDGLSATRHLINHGWKNISVVFISSKISEDSERHRQLLKKMKVEMYLYSHTRKQSMNLIGRADIIIDSLIGYHLQGVPRGDFRALIELINAVPAKVIAYDLPSGLDATTGDCLEPTIRAKVTLSLALPKRAFVTKAGKNVSGKIYIGDIGIPNFLYDKISRGSRPKFGEGAHGLLLL